MTLSANPRSSATHSLEDAMRKPTPAQIRILLITVVCAAVFYTSYSEIYAVALHYTGKARVAATYPICIDAVILIAALTLVARTGVNATAKRWARFGRVFGFTSTILCNAAASGFASADALTLDLVVAVAVSLIPAISLIATVELLIHGAQGTPASRARAAKTARPAATVTRLRAAH